MNEITKKAINRKLRASRVRKSISPSKNRPRLSVHISNKNIIAQIISDTEAKTLVYSDSKHITSSTSLTEKAVFVGEDLAKQAKKKKISTVVFDRGSKLYHGRVKAFAEAARKEGLKF